MRERRRHQHHAVAQHAVETTPDTDAGYGLVEVLVSLTLFMIIATAAAPGMVTALRFADSNENRVVAAGLAAAQIELARGADNPADLAVGTSTVKRNGTTFTIRRLLDPVLECSEAARTRIITIRVQWPGSGAGVLSDTIRAC